MITPHIILACQRSIVVGRRLPLPLMLMLDVQYPFDGHSIGVVLSQKFFSDK